MKKKDLDIKKFTQKEIYDENKNNICVKHFKIQFINKTWMFNYLKKCYNKSIIQSKQYFFLIIMIQKLYLKHIKDFGIIEK